MANETQKPSQDFERQLYDQITLQKGEGEPLPEPRPGSEWPLVPEDDAELRRLAQEKEDNLNAKAAHEPGPESSERIYDEREGAMRTRTGRELNIAIYERRKKLHGESKEF